MCTVISGVKWHTITCNTIVIEVIAIQQHITTWVDILSYLNLMDHNIWVDTYIQSTISLVSGHQFHDMSSAIIGGLRYFVDIVIGK